MCNILIIILTLALCFDKRTTQEWAFTQSLPNHLQCVYSPRVSCRAFIVTLC